MLKKYEHIIFDLDHTLWDFDANCKMALEELYLSHELEKLNAFDVEQLIEKYIEVNARLWNNHHQGLETKENIRHKRFIYTFDELGVAQQHLPSTLNAEFMALCPTKGQLIEGAKDLLDYLSDKYQLHILTNGFKESQYIKMECAGISSYFDQVVIAEECDMAKPQKEIFDFLLSNAGGLPSNSIMIGDDLMVDVLGAKHAGLDHVYYNRYSQPHGEEIMYEINFLSALKNIL